MPVRQRARPFYRPGKLVYGVFLAVCTNVALVGGIVALAMMLAREDRSLGIYVLVAIAVYAVFRMIRYSHALGTKCPLCHGTPLHANKAHKHRDARKHLLLNHRASTILDIACTGSFHCMYCGTPFRLRK